MHRHHASKRGVARERRRPHPGRAPPAGSCRPCCRAGLASMAASRPIAVGRSPPRAGRVRVPPNEEGGSRRPCGSSRCGATAPPSPPPPSPAALTTGHTSRRAPPLPIPAQDSRAALPAAGGGGGRGTRRRACCRAAAANPAPPTRPPRSRRGRLPRLSVPWPPPAPHAHNGKSVRPAPRHRRGAAARSVAAGPARRSRSGPRGDDTGQVPHR